MPIPSLYLARADARPWRVARAAAFGAGIGAVGALFKTLGPFHATAPGAGTVLQIAWATLAFALLCGGAAAIRNFMARRFIRSE